MGLFGGKSIAPSIDASITNSLQQNELIGVFLSALEKMPQIDPQFAWLTQAIGYDDARFRNVIIDRRYITIKPCSLTDPFENALLIDYTDHGYAPIPYWVQGGKTISSDQIVSLWSEILRDRMAAQYPHFQFSDVHIYEPDSSGYKKAYFTYTLPELKWKSWF